MLVVGLILAALAFVLIPAAVHRKRAAQLAMCEKNLKIVLLGHLLYANDHEFNSLPGQITTNWGGTMEYLNSGQIFMHFRKLSNELVDPKLLLCPTDDRQAASSFSTLANANTSYFVSQNNTETSGRAVAWMDGPASMMPIVLGDRNMTNSNGLQKGVAVIDRTQQLGWGFSMHNSRQPKISVGTVGILDGSVSNLTSAQLQSTYNFNRPTRVFFP